MKNKSAASETRRFHRIRHIGRHPLFTVPFVTFMALLALAVSWMLIVSDGNISQLSENRSNLVTVTYDKRERTIPTNAQTVGELLKRLNIALGEGDIVEPSQDTEIVSDNFRINVYRAMPVTIVDGNKKTFTYSAAATPRSIAKQISMDIYPEDILEFSPNDNFLAEGSIGERVVIKRATPIMLNLYGTPLALRTQATTVDDLLEERNVKLGKDDQVLPAPGAKITKDMQIFLIRKGVQVQTVEEEIPMPTETVEDQSLAYGTVAIRQQGAPGKKQVTYQIELQNGQEVGRKVIQEVVSQEPIKRIVARGAIPLTTSLQTWLYKLRMCESGGVYQRNSGNGYYGAYQFLPSTWNSVARKVRPDLVGVRPDLASPEDQDYMIIANTNMTSGLRTQNPGCYKKTGISNYPPANH